jgi:hypothetical protein
MQPNGIAPECSFFFEDTMNDGWSETYHLTQPLTPAQAISIFNEFSPLRMALSPNTVVLLRARFPGQFAHAPIIVEGTGGVGVVGTYTGANANQLPSSVAIRCGLISNQGLKNYIYLRGLPESKVHGDNIAADSTWDTAFTNFANGIVGQPAFCINTSIPTPGSKLPILNLEAGDPKGILMVLSLKDPQLDKGWVVDIHNAGIPGYNGHKVVQTITTTTAANTVYQLGGASPKVDPPSGNNALYSVPQWQQVAIVQVTPENVSQRKSGRPFGQRRGRAATLFSQRQ